MTHHHRRPQSVDFVAKEFDYKDIYTLRKYITETGRMIPSRITGASNYYQRQISKSIKLARYLALLPYTDQHK